MKKLETPNYSDSEVRKYLGSQIRKKGFRTKKDLESLERVRVLFRPFRHVTLKIDGIDSDTGISKFSKSLIDEDLAGNIKDEDHRFLLWRPRLANLLEKNIYEVEESDQYPDNEEAVQEVLDELIRLRWKGQEEDDELKPQLRSLQADPLSVIAFIIPRSPGGLRREEKILDKRKSSHAYVIASSLVTNCSPRDIMMSADIGDRIYIETIVAEYRNLESNATRL
ncbi:unnamed protein product, partial [marine sediment metagenome]